MSFSTATVTHTFTNADGTAASGNIKFTLVGGLMTNGTTSIVPASITAALNASGVLSQSLTSNVDTATWTLASTATSGAVELQVLGDPSYGPQTTTALNFNATAAQVQAAILALQNTSGITASGGPLGSGTITIIGVPGDLTIASTASTLSGGSLAITNTVTGTVPAAPRNTQWRVDIDILGCEQQSYFITVPAGGGSYDLGALLPKTQQVT